MRRLSGILVKTAVALLVITALLVSVLRLTFPHLNDFRDAIVEQIESSSGLALEIGNLEGEWLSFGPSLTVKNLQVRGENYDLAVGEVNLELDVWRSLFNLRWQFRDLTFNQLNLNVNNKNSLADRDIQFEPGSIGDVFLRQLSYFDLKDSNIAFLSPSGAPVSLHISQLTWLNEKTRHQAEGDVILSGIENYHGKLKVILDLNDDDSGVLNRGMIYLQANDVDMRPWLSRWVRTNTGLESANFSLAGWIRIAHRQVEESYLQLKQGDVSWTAADSSHNLDVEDQWFHLTKRHGGWQLDSLELNINSDGNQWPKGHVSLYWQPTAESATANDEEAEILRIRATQLQLEYLKPILPIFTFLDPASLAPWLELNPEGDLSALALDIPLKQPENTKFIARWHNVSWLPWRRLPGVNHFSGYAEGNLNGGYIKAGLTDSVLPYEPVFRAPLEVSRAQGQVYWRRGENGWKLWSNGVDVQSRALWINGDFSYASSEENGPWLSIIAGIHLDDAKEAWRYYPETLMGTNLVNYLTAAIQGGHTQDATLIFEGNPQQFPFPKKTGKFQVFVPLREATLQFQPTWEPVTNLTVNLDFVDNGLWMRARDAKLVNVSAPLIEASIPAYNIHKLYLDADIRGTGNNVYDYLKVSPLRDSVAKALEQVQIPGDVSGRLQLIIPLAAGQLVEASGTIVLNNNDVLIKPVNIMLNNVKGSFDFNNEILTGRRLSANWFGQPIGVSFDTQKLTGDYRINVALNGNWALNKLPILSGGLADDFKGQANWLGRIVINLPNNAAIRYEISLQSSLTKVSERLASLLGSQNGEPIAVKLRAKGYPERFDLSGAVGNNRVNSRWLLGNKQVRVTRAVWRAKTDRIPKLPENNRLILDLPELDGDYWLPLLTVQASAGAASPTGELTFSLPDNLELRSPALALVGQRWQNIALKLDQTMSGSQITVDGDELKARLTTASHRPWLLNIERLYYNPFWPESADSGGKVSTNLGRAANAPIGRTLPVASFRGWPALNVRCGDCWFMGQRFGQLEADLRPSGSLLRLTRGLVDTGNTRLSVTGEWQSTARIARSAFRGTLSGDRFDRSMRHFGVVTPLRNAPFKVDFNAGWQGEPWRPQVNTLFGTVSAQFGQGQLARLGGGTAGQIMKLVSVTALLRKLQTDFSDSFGDGFDFDTIQFNSNIDSGIIRSDNLYINGASADIAMEGSIDLVNQTLNLEAVVAPELSAAAGVATAFAVNPVAGVAVYAAAKVLAPLWSKISFIRYQITGTFDNPEVSEILRQANKEN